MKKVRRSVFRSVAPGQKVLAAVSGGPDSVALAHLLAELRKERPFRLELAHLNHRARGEESDKDAHFVVELGHRLDLPVHVEQIDVAREKKAMRTSFQAAARILRYQFLESVLKKIGGHKIAVGHTAEDQVETVLMNLLRGSGSTGLAGMPETRDAVIRPLQDCFRQELEAYLLSRNLAWRQDPSNLETDYLRNRVRLNLLPLLEAYNPRIRQRLLETARILREEDAFLEDLARETLEKISRPLPGGRGLEIFTKEFNKLPKALQRRTVRRGVRFLKGNLLRLTSHHVAAVLALFQEPRFQKSVSLPGNWIARCGRETVEIRKIPGRESGIQDYDTGSFVPPTKLHIPGRTRMKGSGIQFRAQIHSPSEDLVSRGGPQTAVLDLEKTGTSLQARFFRPGDRFVPLGMKGTKKLKSFFIDAKVPRESRRKIPILTTASDEIIWVYGWRISETYRVTDKTRKILVIEGHQT